LHQRGIYPRKQRLNLKKYPPISEKDKQRLIDVYWEDIQDLEKLLDKDLSNGLK
jgi:hypothetical protein